MKKYTLWPKRLKQSKIFSLKSIATVATAIVFLTLILLPISAPKPALAWSCGEPLPYEGQNYDTVLIGTQCWLAENLNVGTRIDGVNDQGTSCASIEKYCYDNNEANCTSDGALYQWPQAMCGSTTPGAQGICPVGWHIPTHDEWTDLERQVCNDNGNSDCDTTFPKDISTMGLWLGTDEGDSLKIASKCHGGVNCATSGFEFLLAGIRHGGDGSFLARGTSASLWSSLQRGDDVSRAWRRSLNSGYATVYRDTHYKLSGFSVRCLKDTEAGGEAVPEFTTVTLIIAAVAGFGIYFVIKRKKEKATPK